MVIAGCGGESPPPPSPKPEAATQTDAKPATKSTKGKVGPGGRLSPDADLTAREKRALRKGKPESGE
jgi:hypothetical protein